MKPMNKKAKSDDWGYFDVDCKLKGGEVKLDGRELVEYEWLTPEEALKLDLTESYSDTIQKFIEYKERRV